MTPSRPPSPPQATPPPPPPPGSWLGCVIYYPPAPKHYRPCSAAAPRSLVPRLSPSPPDQAACTSTNGRRHSLQIYPLHLTQRTSTNTKSATPNIPRQKLPTNPPRSPPRPKILSRQPPESPPLPPI
ncbi:unnamed protein product [Dicrocoelium dendriticum]|nr:unnamed protein product [Dicrocoelium dendriticum]